MQEANRIVKLLHLLPADIVEGDDDSLILLLAERGRISNVPLRQQYGTAGILRMFHGISAVNKPTPEQIL